MINLIYRPERENPSRIGGRWIGNHKLNPGNNYNPATELLAELEAGKDGTYQYDFEEGVFKIVEESEVTSDTPVEAPETVPTDDPDVSVEVEAKPRRSRKTAE